MKESEVDIRRYSPEDKNRLLAIWLAGSRRAHPFLSEEHLLQQKQLVGDFYLPETETWVAALAGEPVGFIGLLGTFIGGLFVDPERHGLGLGRRLIEHAMALKGDLELEAYALNEAAVGFYRHIGFNEVGRRPSDDSGLPFELIRFRRSR